MSAFERWVERPQTLWVRKAFVQVHLWIGIAVGLYVLTISLSGSAIVFRRELLASHFRRDVTVIASAPRLSSEELDRRIRRALPGYEPYSVREPQSPDLPDEVVLGDGRTRIVRLFDPYTGANLGDPRPALARAVEWLADLHDNLLSGEAGRFLNGIGALLLTVLALTGLTIWWPGIRNWRRGLTINPQAKFARLNWDLHSAVGFWSSLFILVWGISGISLCYPGILDPYVATPLLVWLTRLHFGRFGWATEALWTLLGLAPAVLFCTGFLMWWNRVVRKRLARGFFRPGVHR